jgi:hypothetical protein
LLASSKKLLLCLPVTFGPLVHHIFVPFSTYLSPFLSARVRMLTASEPALGSLIDSAPIASPAMFRSQHAGEAGKHCSGQRLSLLHCPAGVRAVASAAAAAAAGILHT